MRTETPPARTVFRVAVTYLLANGWHRDGDDPGEWIGTRWDDPRQDTLGSALEVQLERDGIGMLEGGTG